MTPLIKRTRVSLVQRVLEARSGAEPISTPQGANTGPTLRRVGIAHVNGAPMRDGPGGEKAPT